MMAGPLSSKNGSLAAKFSGAGFAPAKHAPAAFNRPPMMADPFTRSAVAMHAHASGEAPRSKTIMKATGGDGEGIWDASATQSFEDEASLMRLRHLEEQALYALKKAYESGKKVVFPNALIAGDTVITHLLSRLGYLEADKNIPVLFVNTLHLFEETLDFIEDIEKFYKFKGHISMAEGITGDRYEAKVMYDKVYGADLWKVDIEQYDKVCKVEPFQRGLKDLEAEVIITGRTRWQGNERAWLDIFEAPKKEGGLGNCNPIAQWTLEDTFNYIAHYKIPHHPLHAKGYPSIGDAKDTIPIPEDGTTTFKNFEFQGDKKEWLGYALERKGRFVGLINKDGTTKTECGIHVEGAEKTFDRDLWDTTPSVKELTSTAAVEAALAADKQTLMVVYAPWCQFCQKMEGEFTELSKANIGVDVTKFRGDEEREFIESKLGVKTFPTILSLKNGKYTKYESEDRSKDAMAKFVSDSA